LESVGLYGAIATALTLSIFFGVTVVETSLASISYGRALRLATREATGAKALLALFDSPMGPAMVVRVLSLPAAAACVLAGVALAIGYLDSSWGMVAVVSVCVVTALAGVHVLSMWLAAKHGESIALRAAAGVRAAAFALGPVLAIQARLASRGIGPGTAQRAYFTSDLGLDAEDGELDEHEVYMIRGIFRLDQTIAREIMVPRVDVVAASVGIDLGDLANLMVAEGGHSRIPVYEGDLDSVVGIAYARDVLRVLGSGGGGAEATLQDVMRPALFIPESKSLEELLSEFLQERVQMAIVIDEHGGVSGLVTLEDLLEEIVGEIHDEFDVYTPEVEALGENLYAMNAGVSIERMNQLLGVAVESEGFDTLGGFVFKQLGKIPSPGDAVEYDGIRIEVSSTVGRRPQRLIVEKVSPPLREPQ
jgi:CBS domain containing-hemolysin-like protein